MTFICSLIGLGQWLHRRSSHVGLVCGKINRTFGVVVITIGSFVGFSHEGLTAEKARGDVAPSISILVPTFGLFLTEKINDNIPVLSAKVVKASQGLFSSVGEMISGSAAERAKSLSIRSLSHQDNFDTESIVFFGHPAIVSSKIVFNSEDSRRIEKQIRQISKQSDPQSLMAGTTWQDLQKKPNGKVAQDLREALFVFHDSAHEWFKAEGCSRYLPEHLKANNIRQDTLAQSSFRFVENSLYAYPVLVDTKSSKDHYYPRTCLSADQENSRDCVLEIRYVALCIPSDSKDLAVYFESDVRDRLFEAKFREGKDIPYVELQSTLGLSRLSGSDKRKISYEQPHLRVFYKKPRRLPNSNQSIDFERLPIAVPSHYQVCVAAGYSPASRSPGYMSKLDYYNSSDHLRILKAPRTQQKLLETFYSELPIVISRGRTALEKPSGQSLSLSYAVSSVRCQ
ncbi:MAG: hypothetical protein COT74_05270 [Bdellovibrionales bacterium CG10_big_fil_rev_8_21_14_0_10_45_34]|nr:MAG: hypothetical protein COT74_05270 [Bdellovibrionales bacterium CG10_big_fil_rev_8_21_14_0_10_45_34]